MPAATPPSVTAPAPIIPSTFDLRRVTPAAGQPCRGRSNEIVVCGRTDPSRDRVPALDDTKFAAKPIRAEIGLIGAAKGVVRTEQQEIAPGQVSQRVLVGVKLPF